MLRMRLQYISVCALPRTELRLELYCAIVTHDDVAFVCVARLCVVRCVMIAVIDLAGRISCRVCRVGVDMAHARSVVRH